MIDMVVFYDSIKDELFVDYYLFIYYYQKNFKEVEYIGEF
jgi:hypothetical protein